MSFECPICGCPANYLITIVPNLEADDGRGVHVRMCGSVSCEMTLREDYARTSTTATTPNETEQCDMMHINNWTPSPDAFRCQERDGHHGLHTYEQYEFRRELAEPLFGPVLSICQSYKCPMRGWYHAHGPQPTSEERKAALLKEWEAKGFKDIKFSTMPSSESRALSIRQRIRAVADGQLDPDKAADDFVAEISTLIDRLQSGAK